MSSSWNMIAIDMLFYTDVSADSNLKEDRENGQTTSEMSALFWAYLCRLLINLTKTGDG